MKGATSVSYHHALMGWVSIHAPNEGSDDNESGVFCTNGVVSIHAPNEGSDDKFFAIAVPEPCFNPRSQ